jgi:hypothetical protein
MGARLNCCLIAAYLVIALAFLVERNYPKSLYFLGAVAIGVAVHFMD